MKYKDFEKNTEGYKNVVSYLLSDVLAGEIVGIDNYSQVVTLFDDKDTKIDIVRQLNNEVKHIYVLNDLAKKNNINLKNQVVEPYWHELRKTYTEAVSRRDLMSCILIQDLMIESLAVAIYRTLARNTDKETCLMANAIEKDELEHWEVGIDRLKKLADKDPDGAFNSLKWTMKHAGPSFAALTQPGCVSLCGELGMDCGTVSLGSIKTDKEEIGLEMFDYLVDALEKVGFSPKDSNPLLLNIMNPPEEEKEEKIVQATSCCG